MPLDSSIYLGSPLNRSSPLARGLLRFWVPLPNTSGGSRLFDPAGQKPLIRSGSAAWAAGPKGRPAINSPDTADYLSPAAAVDTGVTALTVAGWYKVANSGFNTATLYDSYTSASGDGVRLYLDGAASATLTFTKAVSYAGGTVAANAATVADAWYFVTGTVSAAGTVALFVNGVKQSGSATLAGTVAAPKIPVVCGGGASRSITGTEFMVWGRGLSDDEAKLLWVETQQFYPTLLNRIRRRSVAFAGGGGGGGFQAAWAMRSTVVLGGAF